MRPHRRGTWHISTTEHDAGIRRGRAYRHLDPMAEVDADASGANFVFNGALFDHRVADECVRS
jgi:hypothetical protein